MHGTLETQDLETSLSPVAQAFKPVSAQAFPGLRPCQHLPPRAGRTSHKNRFSARPVFLSRAGSSSQPPCHRFLFLLLLACSFLTLPAGAAVTVTGLRCEYLENPLGIDVDQPHLSWQLQSPTPGEHQSAYQIVVCSTVDKVHAAHGDLWDTGKVISDQSSQILYNGLPQSDWADSFWKVRVWDKNGKASPWSTPARWSLGIRMPQDWQAKWIGLDGENQTNFLSGADWIWAPVDHPESAAPPGTNYFRRTFVVPADKPVCRAHLQTTADSESHVYLNDGDLGVRKNFHSVRDSEITARIHPGTNVLGIMAINQGPAPKAAGTVALLQVEFADGQQLTLSSDEHWKVTDHEVAGWMDKGFDDSAWASAKRLGPVGMAPWGPIRSAEARRLAARWLRRDFLMDKRLKRAMLSFSGLGLSELYLNGQRVGEQVLSPGFTDYSNRVPYLTFDVTSFIRKGTNTLGAILGNGRFFAPRSMVYGNTRTYGFPKLLLHLRIECLDNSTIDIVSDESWDLTADGPLLANNEYDGEEYDARKELAGWNQPGYNALQWQRAQIVSAPAGLLSAQKIHPTRVVSTIKPVSFTTPRPGVFMYDLGQNIAGWCRLKVSGPAGTTVSLHYAETLKPDGSLFTANLRTTRATDLYTLKGEGTEVWEPRFVTHGFRYVEVQGLPGVPTLETLEGRVVHDDLPEVGQFACSHPLLNRIYTNLLWSTRNNYHSIPTDCPQRDERQGWLGDRGEESRGELYLFDAAAFYGKWLQDIADSQKPDGSLPDIAPPYWPFYTDNVSWPSTSILLANNLYRHYGDTNILARQYDCNRKWLDHMLTLAPTGLSTNDTYGDWCVPPEDRKRIETSDPKRITAPSLVATAYLYYDLTLMQRHAALLSKPEDAARYAKLAQTVKTAFNNRFFHRELGQYDNGTQTSSVLPLFFGLVPDDQRQRVFQHLATSIETETHGHIGTGLIGGQFLNRVLTDNGRPDLAWTIATQTDYPSWGYMVEHGATTIWELWNGDTADPSMNSGDHVMLVGDLGVWLFETLAGIQSDPAQPGFKQIVLKPIPVGDLTWVSASTGSPYGRIASAWKKLGNGFDWEVTIPPNSSATLYIPASGPETVTEGGKPAVRAGLIEFLRMENGRAVYFVAPGHYHFRST